MRFFFTKLLIALNMVPVHNITEHNVRFTKGVVFKVKQNVHSHKISMSRYKKSREIDV
jgi:hypothetical protein